MKTRLLPTMALLAVMSSVALSGATLAVRELRCEYRVDPVGLGVVEPRLSWTLASDQRGQKQTAYQILVATSPELLARNEGDLWDTGKVNSDQTVQVVYDGKPLRSRVRAWWKVQVWDKDGGGSGWSAPAHWSMGLLDKADWQAKWIADPVSVTNVLLSGPRNGYHSQFATNANVPKWIALDLGQPQNFDAVRLFPARPYDWQPDTPGFLFPVRFRIEAAQKSDFPMPASC